jgi:hypothetical protein
VYRLYVRDVQSCVSHLSLHSIQNSSRSIYTTSAIRGNPLTEEFGSHLETCPATGGIPNWPDVQDQQIPSSLQVSQNLNQGQSGVSSGASLGIELDWWRIWMGILGLAVVRLTMIAMVEDPVDICFT